MGGTGHARYGHRVIKTKVVPTKNIFTGYRLLSSFDALEIFYHKALLGSVKISPKDTPAFLSELKKRCPHLQIQP
nr:hypothetical protein [Bacillota bacterium]